ncbi:MAG: class I SAM-dependent methyltransferase [Bowdeniella nasicola]|nr:class I SAM-dependent methyltransferase [Bowdeniella nasicola]
MTSPSRWERITTSDPDHSIRYIERFRRLAAEGFDLDGEARACDALLERGSRVVDAGCGPGRVSHALAERGHHVVGLDIDPVLLKEARAVAASRHIATTADGEGGSARFIQADLREPYPAEAKGADLIVCSGNVITFFDDDEPAQVLLYLADALSPTGRAVVGFGLTRGYSLERFEADCAAAGLSIESRFSTWQFHPMTEDSDFMVAITSLTSPQG